MDLNTTNINSILGNLSCCIGSLGLQAIQDAKLGNNKCYKKHLQDVVLLDNIYKILKKGFYYNNETYFATNVDFIKPLDTALGIAFYINDELITYAETEPGSSTITTGIDTLISNIEALNNGTLLSYVVVKGETSYLNMYYQSNTCEYQEVKIQLYEPPCDSPPYGCDYDPALGTPYGDPIIFTANGQGCCTEEYCYVSEDLEALYDMALKLCKICKNC